MPKRDGRKTALITGASSGIGFELARIFARDGHDLVLVAANRDRLERSAAELRCQGDIEVRTVAKDLAKPGASSELVAYLAEASVAVDVLVNNAGYNVYGLFNETDPETELRLLQLHIVSLTHLTKLLLPSMLARRFGRILNVGSTASFMPGVPLNAVYCASKSYVLSFSEGIAADLEGSGVTVTALCPGATLTPFIERAEMQRSNLFAGTLMSPERVASAGYRALTKGKRVMVPGLRNKYLVLSARFFPRSLLTNLSKTIMGHKRSVWAWFLRLFTFLDPAYKAEPRASRRGGQ